MSTADIPVIGKTKPQAQTSAPPNSDDTIMDDTVVLMDGDGLMGGLTTTRPIMPLQSKVKLPQARIRIRR